MSSEPLWIARSLFGAVALSSLTVFIHFKTKLSPLQYYNLFGVLGDGLGGIFLILLASFIYPLIGFTFNGAYEYIVFAFVAMTGVAHYLAFKYETHTQILTQYTVIVRVVVSSVFLALYFKQSLGVEALLIALFDISFASIYLIWFSNKELPCKK